MTVRQQRQRQKAQERGMPLAAGGWGGWMSDPAAIQPPSVYNQSIAGVIVNERSVLSIMAVAACLRVLGDAAGGLVPHVHRQEGNRPKFSDPEIDPPDVVMDPCADIDRDQADFNVVASLGLNGNAYFHVLDRERGYPTLIEILSPSNMIVREINGKKIYKVGSETSPPIPPQDMVHVPWMSLAGAVVGLNPIEIGAVGFGVPLAETEYASRFFAQGIHPTGVLSVDKPIREPDKERLTTEIMTRHGGLAQSHSPIILDANAKWQQISVNPETAQLLQSRAFSRSEIAGFYGVPGHLIGDVQDSQTYGKGLQEMVMGFALFALSGYTRRLDRMYTQLLPAGYYVRRNVSDLFNTNYEMLGAFVSALRMNAVATPNEVREYLRLPPTNEDGADSLWGPINSAHSDFMLPSGGALAAQVPTPALTGPPALQRDDSSWPWPSWRPEISER